MKKSWNQIIGQYFISIVCLTFSFLVLFDFIQARTQVTQLNQTLQDKETELVEKLREQEALVKQKDKLSDPNYVKEYARGNFMLTQENEQVFILPKQANE